MSKIIIAKEFTQGDTFKAALTISRTIDNVTAVVDLTNVTMISQVRLPSGKLIADVTITPVDLPNGKIKVRAESAVSVDGPPWPAGILHWDVQFLEAGDTWSMPVRGLLVNADNSR